MWSMRFEAKHRVFKNMLKNFKNITKSLAKKHQLSIACHWETSHLKQIEYGPLKSINVDNEDYGNVLALALHVESVSQPIHATSWVTISGTEYRAGVIICSEADQTRVSNPENIRVMLFKIKE